MSLARKHILVGITGGIAAYKSAELVRALRRKDAEVRVVMTRAACQFITPLTLQVLSNNPVHIDLFDVAAEAAMGHIELARWSDAIVVVPASADFIARLAGGRADDLLATLCLARNCPLLLAPAMNPSMWQNAATKANVNTLEQRGIQLVGPVDGWHACGETGHGRLLEPEHILQQIQQSFCTDILSGVSVLVSAGPTREAIDAVRYLSNRSSGRMGYAIAEAAADMGATVTLISGPVALPAPKKLAIQAVNTAAQMHAAVMAQAATVDIFISAAAVADYYVQDPSQQKIKKHAGPLTLSLAMTPDILTDVTALSVAPFTVGFAAETEHLKRHAKQKLQQKRLDMIIANEVGDNLGFDCIDNALEIYWRIGHRSLPKCPKTVLAKQLLETIAEQFYAKYPDRRAPHHREQTSTMQPSEKHGST